MSQKNSGGEGAADPRVTPFRDVNADSAQRRIADDLQEARLARGLEVADAARALRIRAVYLAALEEGRFADLPGPTYVAGFLRAYGRFLALDGDELVRRYKDETGGVLATQQLNFPVPASEARHPTGFMIAAALIVALAVAGAWYVMEERRSDVVELVPEVPAEIVEAAEDALAATTGLDVMATEAEKALAADQPADIAVSEPADDVQAATQEAGDIVAENQDIPSVTVDETAAEAVEAEVVPEAAAEVEAEAGAEVVPETAAEPAPEVEAEVVAEAAAPESEVAEAAAPEEAAAGDMAASEAEIMVANGYVPRVYGRTNTDSRVEVRAVEETWIQIEGGGNEILLTRVLLPGDIYRVPNRDDVTLDTGNAGGLEVRLDGVLVAPLGEPGIVIRRVSLAPDDLLAR